jgi:serine/threonine-protein kinase
MGTVAYMSPEQARGEDLDPRTDLFSFGAVLYEMATSRLAFPGSTNAVVFHSIFELTPANPSAIKTSIPPRFDEITQKALEKDRTLRYQTAAEIGADLKRLKRDTDSNRTTSVSARKASASQKSKRNTAVAVIAIALAIAIGIAIAYSVYTARHANSNSPAQSSLAPKSIDSVAVLPFVNASGDPKTEYLSEGITQDLIHTLSQIPKLKVVSLMSVYRYKGKNVDPRAVASELGVHTILNGRMLQNGDNVSITAELVDADHDSQLWSKQYQRTFADISTVQSDISRDIAQNLKLKIAGSSSTQAPTQNSEAYQLYLQGRFYWNRRTAGGVNEAIDFFQQAISKDPNYALAYSGLADSYFSLARNSDVLSPKEASVKARAAAEKAVELDISSAEAHASLGLERMIFEWDFSGSEREFRRAIELNPGYSYAHTWYAELLYSTGHYEDSVRETRTAVELDPFSPMVRANLVLSLTLAGQYPEATTEVHKLLDMDPNFPFTHCYNAELLILGGKYDEAASELEKTIRSIPESSFYRAYLGYAYAKAGRAEDARKILTELTAAAQTKYVSWLGIADIYNGLGETDHAFAALELAFQQGDTRMNGIRARAKVDSQPVSDARFAALLKRIGLPPL